MLLNIINVTTDQITTMESTAGELWTDLSGIAMRVMGAFLGIVIIGLIIRFVKS